MLTSVSDTLAGGSEEEKDAVAQDIATGVGKMIKENGIRMKTGANMVTFTRKSGPNNPYLSDYPRELIIRVHRSDDVDLSTPGEGYGRHETSRGTVRVVRSKIDLKRAVMRFASQ